MPDLLDTGANGRNELIEMQKTLAERNKRRPFGWVWTVAGKQPELEQALGIGGFGFPAMAALNAKKLKFATHRRAFEDKAIQDFVSGLVAGREPTAPLAGAALPKIATVEAWDGQDAAPPTEEEIDLAELEDMDLDEGLKKEEL